MRPREPAEDGQNDLFRARLDQIIALDHALVRLARTIDWGFLDRSFGTAYTDAPGRPPLSTRLMAGLAILKHMHDLSDEALCERWVENPYFQFFCGEVFFRHELIFDRSSLTRWRQRMGEDRLTALVQESLAVAVKTGAAKPADFTRVIIDTTVQEKAISFPTDAKLMHRARERLVRLARKAGVDLHRSADPAHPRRSRLQRPQRPRALPLQGLYPGPEAAGYRGHQTPAQAPRRRRTGYRPSQERAPHDPQSPGRLPRRRRQRRPRRCRLQLPSPAQVARASLCPHPGNL